MLAYLEKLANENEILLISFEKKDCFSDQDRRETLRARLLAASIIWIPLRYHRSPKIIATGVDIILGTSVAICISLIRRPNLVHARSYVPALIALAIKRVIGARFVFDMRGFWADERTDGGLWQEDSPLYRLTKWFERLFLVSADHIITLTHSSLVPLRKMHPNVKGLPPISVIPTCVDLDRFSPVSGMISREGFTLGYVGSVGTWYLLDEMLLVFKALLRCRKDARLLFINQNQRAMVQTAAANAGIDPSRIEITSAAFPDVPNLINRMDAGLMLIKPCFSKIASAPTKLAEYLACGVPCLGNVGVGDVEQILESHHVGVALKRFDPLSIDQAVERMLILVDDPQTSIRCRTTAEKFFSLEEGVFRYSNVYKSFLTSGTQGK